MQTTPALQTLASLSHYVTYTDFGGHIGLGHACDPTDFDGAVDAFADQMDEGNESRVYRIEAGAGRMVDVTLDAMRRVRRRLLDRSPLYEMPEWMEAA